MRIQRERSAPLVRTRRTRPSGAGTEYTVPRAESDLSGYGEGEQVEIVLRIKANVTEGNMHRGDLANWVVNALHSYYTFRHGCVGINANAKISMPLCARCDTLAD